MTDEGQRTTDDGRRMMTDDGQRVFTIAHPELCSGELKTWKTLYIIYDKKFIYHTLYQNILTHQCILKSGPNSILTPHSFYDLSH